MAKIISISLSKALAEEMGLLQKKMRFSGRSELFRAGLRKLMAESREQEKLKGKRECLLLAIHNKQAENDLTAAKHEFDDIISTQIHNNLANGQCLEIFILRGEAGRIKRMHLSLETNKKIDYVKLLVT